MRPRRHSYPSHPIGDTHSTPSPHVSSAQEIQIASLAAPQAAWPRTAPLPQSSCVLLATGIFQMTSDASADVMDTLGGEAHSCSRGKQGLHPASGFSHYVSACWFPSPVCDAFNQFYPQQSRLFPSWFCKPFSSELSRLACWECPQRPLLHGGEFPCDN